MSSVDKFEINLEHDIDEQYQYEPGETLRGNIILHLNEPIKLKAIQVQIRGEATVSWEDELPRTRTVVNTAEEMYVDNTQSVVEPRGGSSSLELEKGRHSFLMEYILPPTLPSSFIGKFGSITYVAKATLREDNKFGMNTMITSEPFLVLRQLDLTKEPSVLQQREETREKSLHSAFFCCMAGQIIVNLKLNKTGFLPGEDIFMDAEITNSSPRVTKAVQAIIVMHSKFHAKNNTRYNKQIVNKKRDDWEMSKGEGRRWKAVRLTIPAYIPESRLDGCDIIDIMYEFIFKVEVSGGNDIEIAFPLLIGTTIGSDERNGNILTQLADDSQDATDFEEMELQEGFRRPMEPGDTRSNPLYSQQTEGEQFNSTGDLLEQNNIKTSL